MFYPFVFEFSISFFQVCVFISAVDSSELSMLKSIWMDALMHACIYYQAFQKFPYIHFAISNCNIPFYLVHVWVTFVCAGLAERWCHFIRLSHSSCFCYTHTNTHSVKKMVFLSFCDVIRLYHTRRGLKWYVKFHTYALH